jgi:hypothetical protein
MDRKRKRQSGVELWTAARCRRLLRPIASRIAPLRRHQYTINTESSRNITGKAESSARQLNKTSDLESVNENQTATSLDPTWLPPDHRPNHQLKKYSIRYRNSDPTRDQHVSPQACLVTLPTPFKARALRRGTPVKKGSLNAEIPDSPCVPKNLPLAKKRRQRGGPLTRAPTAKQSIELQGRQNYEKTFELHQGVTDGFSLLLQRTSPLGVEEQPRKGAPSLLSICLRKVPEYIRAEETWRKIIDENDDTDVSGEVYEELESLGSVQGQGWPGLREVVIAHGVSLVHDIIRDKLVTTEARAELARMPLRHGLQKASEDLLLAYTHSLALKRPLGVDSRLFNGCLSSLTDTHPASASNGTFVRTLGSLFSTGHLRLSWLATRDMATLSSGMIRALASHSESPADILLFLQSRLLQICHAELAGNDIVKQGPEGKVDAWIQLEKSLTNTSTSIVTVLAAIALIERNAQDSAKNGPGPSTAAETLLMRVSIEILRSLEKSSRLHHRRNGVAFAVLASSLVLSKKSGASNHRQVLVRKQDIIQGMFRIHGEHTQGHVETVIERAALFLDNLSRCCGQSLHSDSQTYLELLVRSILEDSQQGSELEKTFLKQWALESSLRFAKTCATQKSRSFLEEVETCLTQQKPLQTATIGQDCLPITGAGLRWEEGLCEWIVTSPFCTKKSRRSAVQPNKPRTLDDSDAESDLDDSGCLSDVQETPAPRRRATTEIRSLASPDVLGMDMDSFCSDTDFEAAGRRIGSTPSVVPSICQTIHRPQGLGKPEDVREIRSVVISSSCHVVTQSSSDSSLVEAVDQLACSRKQVLASETICEMLEDEVDELAMSCSKPSRFSHIVSRRSVRSEPVGKVSFAIRRRNASLETSDDELGS